LEDQKERLDKTTAKPFVIVKRRETEVEKENIEDNINEEMYMNVEERQKMLESFRTDIDAVKDLECFLEEVKKVSNIDEADKLEEHYKKELMN
jgi:hypothetical protein